MNNINNPHDNYFRTMLSNQEVARDFLDWHLPDYIKEIVDLNTIEVKKDTFVDDNFKKLETDILFSINVNNSPGYIYTLVEAQSKPERLMPLRLMKYLIAIMEHHLKNSNDKKLPTIYPLILYQGDREWNYTTNFFELFQEPGLVGQILNNDFQLVDVQRVPDSKFNEHFWAGLFEYCIKWGAKRDLINALEHLKPDLIKVRELNRGVLIATLTYLGQVGDTDTNKLIEWSKHAGPIGDDTMTLAERLRDEGFEKGVEQGIEKGIEQGVEQTTEKTALKMLAEKMELDFISRVTELSIEDIQKLQAKNQHTF